MDRSIGNLDFLIEEILFEDSLDEGVLGDFFKFIVSPFKGYYKTFRPTKTSTIEKISKGKRRLDHKKLKTIYLEGEKILDAYSKYYGDLYGSKNKNKILRIFLDARKLGILGSLNFLGIKVDVSHTIKLAPIKNLQLSSKLKLKYSKLDIYLGGSTGSSTKAALAYGSLLGAGTDTFLPMLLSYKYFNVGNIFLKGKKYWNDVVLYQILDQILDAIDNYKLKEEFLHELTHYNQYDDKEDYDYFEKRFDPKDSKLFSKYKNNPDAIEMIKYFNNESEVEAYAMTCIASLRSIADPFHKDLKNVKNAKSAINLVFEESPILKRMFKYLERENKLRILRMVYDDYKSFTYQKSKQKRRYNKYADNYELDSI